MPSALRRRSAWAIATDELVDVGLDDGGDQMFHILYDGTVVDEMFDPTPELVLDRMKTLGG